MCSLTNNSIAIMIKPFFLCSTHNMCTQLSSNIHLWCIQWVDLFSRLPIYFLDFLIVCVGFCNYFDSPLPLMVLFDLISLFFGFLYHAPIPVAGLISFMFPSLYVKSLYVKSICEQVLAICALSAWSMPICFLSCRFYGGTLPTQWQWSKW